MDDRDQSVSTSKPVITEATGARASARFPMTGCGHTSIQCELSTLRSIRETVAECLSAFAATAARQRREALWTLAHERWSGWRFSEGDTGVPLVGIGSSELDYAIVGFAVECMSAAQRAEKKAAFIAELSELSDVWHGSVTDFMRRLIASFLCGSRMRTRSR